MRGWVAPGVDDGPRLRTVPLAWASILVAMVIAVNEIPIASIAALSHRLTGYAADLFVVPALGVLLAMVLLHGFHSDIELTPRWSDVWWLPWAAVATVIQLDISTVVELFTGPSARASPLPTDVPRLAMVLVLTVIAAPILEEFVWRGVLQPALIGAGFHPIAAILIASGTWGAAHFGHGGGYGLATVLGIAAGGYVQGVIVYRTGRLMPAIAVHAAGNVLTLMTHAGFRAWIALFVLGIAAVVVQLVVVLHTRSTHQPPGCT